MPIEFPIVVSHDDEYGTFQEYAQSIAEDWVPNRLWGEPIRESKYKTRQAEIDALCSRILAQINPIEYDEFWSLEYDVMTIVFEWPEDPSVKTQS